MELLPSLALPIATCGAVGAVYAPISFSSSLSNNSVSTSEQVSLSGEQGRTQEQTRNLPSQRRLSEEGPILSCAQWDKSYEVYLVAKAGGGVQSWKKDSAKDLVTFKVVDVKGDRDIVWGSNDGEDNKWTNWTILFTEDGKVKLSFPTDGKNYHSRGYSTVECQSRKIDKVLSERGREVVIIALRENDRSNVLSVEVDASQCSNITDGKEEACNINFSSKSNLKWVEGFSPKAIFQLEGSSQ